MASIFTKIIRGEIPSYKIAESEEFYAFLDIRPLAKGHTLVVPKVEVDKLFDLDDHTYQGLFAFCKQVAAGIKRSVACNRVALTVIGLEVPHAHVHLIPINTMGDVDFSKPKVSMTNEEMESLAALIRRNI